MADALLVCVPLLGVLGLAALVANIALSFEEPHGGLLAVAAALLAAVPLVVAFHLLVTSTLTPEEKRAWFVGLLSFSPAASISAYLGTRDRQPATARLMAARQARS